MAGRIQALSERKYLGVNIVNAVNVVTAVNAARSQPRKGVNMKSHKDLDVWRLAVDLATDVYEVTRTFPKEGSTVCLFRCVAPQYRLRAILPKEQRGTATKSSFSSSISR
jgi:hypothetical protein